MEKKKDLHEYVLSAFTQVTHVTTLYTFYTFYLFSAFLFGGEVAAKMEERGIYFAILIIINNSEPTI